MNQVSHALRCGLNRRQLVQWSVLAPLGLSLSTLSAASSPETENAGGFGSAKRCILIYLWGSPSQLETFDPKPDAPREIQGEFGSIESVEFASKEMPC